MYHVDREYAQGNLLCFRAKGLNSHTTFKLSLGISKNEEMVQQMMEMLAVARHLVGSRDLKGWPSFAHRWRMLS